MDDKLAALVALSAGKDVTLRWNGACYVPCKGEEIPPRGYKWTLVDGLCRRGCVEESEDGTEYRITDKGRKHMEEKYVRRRT